MKLPIATFYPAHSSNYTKGRNRAVKFITIHHTAANNSTLRHLWANPARNGSSHFFVHGSRIEQYVDTKDTAWTNGNWASNNECITIEVNGDWRGGFRNQAALNNLEKLMREIIKHYPNIGINYHNDISSTQCPGELKSKGLARAIYDKIKKENQVSKISYKKITPKKVELTKDAKLWDFNFTSWSAAKPVKSYKKGHVADVVAEAKNQLGGVYYMTAYSYNNGKIRSTHGFNKADTKNYTAPAPKPPKPPENCDAVKKELWDKEAALEKANKQHETTLKTLEQKTEELDDQIDLNESHKRMTKKMGKEIVSLNKENAKLLNKNADLVLELGEKGELSWTEHLRLSVKKLIERIKP